MTYNEYISTIIKQRGLHGIPANTYKEIHHIIPICMDGTNDDTNLIDLYAREHFIAHKLLAQEYPDNYKLQYAYSMMAFCTSKNQLRYELTSEEYELVKKAAATATSMMFSGTHWYYHKDTHKMRQFKDDDPNLTEDWILGYPDDYIFSTTGKKWSIEHNQRLSESKKGKHQGKHWYNNGIIEVARYECPSGFKQGRLKFSDNTKKQLSQLAKQSNSQRSIEQKQQIAKKLHDQKIGKHVYNNGIICIRAVTCPEGFVPGFLKTVKKSKIWIHSIDHPDYKLMIDADQTIPPGFCKGMGSVKSLEHRHWWTNGIIQKWCLECPGDDWYLGHLHKRNK